MRFKITLLLKNKNTVLPFNYQYLISSWIYNTIKKADKEFANFLHEEGITIGHKQFRFFTFSPLDIRPFRKQKEGFLLLGDSISLEVAFHLDKSASHFIQGLFLHQTGFFNHLQFEVGQIESSSTTYFSEKINYQSLSPITLSYRSFESNYPQYALLEKEEHFKELFINNLIQRYMAKQFHLSNEVQNQIIDLEIIKNRGSKLIDIKGTKVKAYQMNFLLIAPQEIHELVCYAGAGEKGSQGFGYCEII